MAVSRERFEQGMTYEQFKEQMTRNQERFVANEHALTLESTDLAAFQHLPQPLNVLVIAEDWCGDVVDNLPILGRVAHESGKLNVRVFLRDQNLDLIDQYLKEGKFRSIPVFVFFDDAFNEIGRLIERPESVTARRAEQRREIYARHPEFGSPETPISQLPEDVRVKLMEEMAAMRDTSRTADSQETVRALREIVAVVRA